MVHPEFREVPSHAVAVEDRSDPVDDLPHPATEPSLYAAVDLRVVMLETLLASRGHTEPSRLVSAPAPMQRSGAPEVPAKLPKPAHQARHLCSRRQFLPLPP